MYHKHVVSKASIYKQSVGLIAASCDSHMITLHVNHIIYSASDRHICYACVHVITRFLMYSGVIIICNIIIRVHV